MATANASFATKLTPLQSEYFSETFEFSQKKNAVLGIPEKTALEKISFWGSSVIED